MIIRQMQNTDINGLIECIKTQAVDADLPTSDAIDTMHLSKVIKEALIDNRYCVYVATQNNEIVGFCAGMLNMKHWNPTLYGEIFFIYTHPEHRSKKLADQLMDTMCEWFDEQNCAYILSSVMHFDEHYEPRDDYMRKGEIYFKSKGMKPVGCYFVKQIVRENEGL